MTTPGSRRRGLVIGGLSAAAAVAVALVIALRSSSDDPATATARTPDPTSATTSAATSPATKELTTPPAPGVLDVSALPVGDAPRMEYVTGGTKLHQIDGSTLDIPTRYPVSSFVALADGSHLWLTAHHGTPYVEVQDGEGTLHDPVRSGWDLGVSSSHTVGAWVRPDGQVMVWNVGATRPLAYGDPVPAASEPRMGPVLGHRCGAGESCEVYLNVPDQHAASGWQPWEVSVNGTERLRDGDLRFLADRTESGVSIGYRRITDTGSCSVLLGGGEFHGFSTCRHTLESFSPDGALILGVPAYRDGIGDGVLAMYDLDGHLLFERRNSEKAQSFFASAQWEYATHVLAPVFQDGKWSIVRFASDGSMEYALAPVRGQDVHNPYVLSEGGPAIGD